MEVPRSEGWFLLLNKSLESDSPNLVENLYAKYAYLVIWSFMHLTKMSLSVICFHYFSNLKIIAHHKTVKIGINDHAEVSE